MKYTSLEWFLCCKHNSTLILTNASEYDTTLLETDVKGKFSNKQYYNRGLLLRTHQNTRGTLQSRRRKRARSRGLRRGNKVSLVYKIFINFCFIFNCFNWHFLYNTSKFKRDIKIYKYKYCCLSWFFFVAIVLVEYYF